MAGLLSYSPTSVIKNNATIGTVGLKLPVSTTAKAAYEKYQNYSQSNVFQVGSWTQGGVGGTTVFTLNDNWATVCKDFGIKAKHITVLAQSTSSLAPSAAQKLDFWDNVLYYFPKAVNFTDYTEITIKYNNVNHPLYAAASGTVSNFRRTVQIPIYDPVANHWYIVGLEYRTDNFNPGKVWLTTSNPGNQSTMMPASGVPIINPADPGMYTPEADAGGGQDREPSAGGTVGLPSLPTISSVGTGLLQLYNPSKAQLVNLGRYLWSNDFNLDNLKKLFSNPMDVILGLSIFPVTIPSAGSENIMLGNLDSGVGANVASQQYVSKDFGTLTVDEYYQNYLDYDPYTRIEIFLPYIGTKELSPDDVMGKTLSLNYSIDLLSGACVAHIRVNGKLTYEFSGVCNTQIPITSLNYTSVITGILGMVGGALATGAVGLAGIGAATKAAEVTSAGMKGLLGMGASTAASVMSQKRRYEHSGSIGSAAGYLAGQTPYLLITTPRWCKPGEQPHFTGYPGFLYRQVSQLSGFTIFVNLEVTRVHCTQGELDEIIDWFTNKGVRI